MQPARAGCHFKERAQFCPVRRFFQEKTPEILAAAGGWGATHFFVAAGVSRIICLRRAFEKRRPTREFEPTPVENQRPLSAQKRLDGRPCGRAENGRAALPRRPDLILVSV